MAAAILLATVSPSPAHPDGKLHSPDDPPRQQPGGPDVLPPKPPLEPIRPRPPDRNKPRGERPARPEVPGDLLMLDRLLAMPSEELGRMRESIERIEAMSPEEREALRERLREFRHIPPAKRQKMRQKWREMSPEERRERMREFRERRWEKLFEEEEAPAEEGESAEG